MTTFTEEQKSYWSNKLHLKRRTPNHPIVALYAKKKLEFIQKHVDLGSSALDVGAGNGYLTQHMNNIIPTTAVDYSETMLTYNPVPNKQVMDARKLEYPDNAFDTVFCHALLHHIDPEDQVTVVKEMGRVAKKNVIIIEPNRNNPIMFAFGIVKKEERCSLKFSCTYTRGLAEKAGLSVIFAHSYGLLTPNRMPIPKCCLPFFKLFERPVPFGVTNIIIAKP